MNRTRQLLSVAVPGLGGFLAIWLVISFGDVTGLPLVTAPFGATCVLAFALPASPLAQPRNIVGGHLLSTLIGLALLHTAGVHPWSVALAVGCAIVAMQLTGTLHPPAGADPLVVMLAGAGWTFLWSPILLGSVLIVLLAWAVHRLSGVTYPKQWR
jgi:CBS-domain-containing membrane protein